MAEERSPEAVLLPAAESRGGGGLASAASRAAEIDAVELKLPLDETMARLRCLATAAIVVVTLLGSLLLGILAPRPQRLPRWSDGTAAMAGRVVAEGWRCRAGQPQAACIRKLLRRLRGGRLRPFRTIIELYPISSVRVFSSYVDR